MKKVLLRGPLLTSSGYGEHARQLKQFDNVIGTLRNQMGKNSNQMVQKFDWKNVVESIIDEYQSINS